MIDKIFFVIDDYLLEKLFLISGLIVLRKKDYL